MLQSYQLSIRYSKMPLVDIAPPSFVPGDGGCIGGPIHHPIHHPFPDLIGTHHGPPTMQIPDLTGTHHGPPTMHIPDCRVGPCHVDGSTVMAAAKHGHGATGTVNGGYHDGQWNMDGHLNTPNGGSVDMSYHHHHGQHGGSISAGGSFPIGDHVTVGGGYTHGPGGHHGFNGSVNIHFP